MQRLPALPTLPSIRGWDTSQRGWARPDPVSNTLFRRLSQFCWVSRNFSQDSYKLKVQEERGDWKREEKLKREKRKTTTLSDHRRRTEREKENRGKPQTQRDKHWQSQQVKRAPVEILSMAPCY